jgi:cell surface protein SprA
VVTDPDGNVSGVFDLGHTIQNSNVHAINTSFNFDQLYRNIGLVKKTGNRGRNNAAANRNPNSSNPPPNSSSSAGRKATNTLIDIVTMVKRAQVTYQSNSGTFLPGYLPVPGWLGTLKPSLGFTFGGQRDIRQRAAENGWLTLYPEFNQQYTELHNTTFDYSANLEPFRDLKIDLVGNRIYSESTSENFRVDDLDGRQTYVSLSPNTFGNFSISSAIIATSFSKSNETRDGYL